MCHNEKDKPKRNKRSVDSDDGDPEKQGNREFERDSILRRRRNVNRAKNLVRVFQDKRIKIHQLSLWIFYFPNGGEAGICKDEQCEDGIARMRGGTRRRSWVSVLSRKSTEDVRGMILSPSNSRQHRVKIPALRLWKIPLWRVGFCWRSVCNVNRI